MLNCSLHVAVTEIKTHFIKQTNPHTQTQKIFLKIITSNGDYFNLSPPQTPPSPILNLEQPKFLVTAEVERTQDKYIYTHK